MVGRKSGTALKHMPTTKFYGDRFSLPGCSGQRQPGLLSLVWRSLRFGLIQGPFWWCLHLSAKMQKCRDSVSVSGRLAGHITDWQFLPLLAPPKFGLLVFSGASCCETTHARSDYCVWPGRRESSVNSSLIIWTKKTQRARKWSEKFKMWFFYRERKELYRRNENKFEQVYLCVCVYVWERENRVEDDLYRDKIWFI